MTNRCLGARLLALMLMAGGSASALAAQARVAVATNFAGALARLQPQFEQRTGHKLRISAGATGALYAQIVQGAPFDVFLAADRARPAKLFAHKQAVAAPFTYAQGQLQLWSADIDLSEAALKARLQEPAMTVAIANEKLAPYGRAAQQALATLSAAPHALRLVRGQNVGQAYALAAGGNAPVALIAASLSALRPGGSGWLVPATAYDPIEQDGVLLKRGANNAAAQAFVEFLLTAPVQAQLATLGYRALGDRPGKGQSQ